MNQKQLKKEWKKMEKAEAAYLKRNLSKEGSAWKNKVSKYVPDQFESILTEAFFKAFRLVFDKGMPVIEKTYDREKKEKDYKVQKFAAQLKNDPGSVKAFRQTAAKSRIKNSGISAVEGMGMGILGMGLPDIPVFIGLLLKSIYEIALSYGFNYESEKEQIFILKIMETALLQKEELADGNGALNRIVEGREKMPLNREKQMRRTAEVLANELLYLKFVQGIPIVGIFGGASDVIYQKKISEYAELKYKRRFYYREIEI